MESEFRQEPAVQICLKECPEAAARALIWTVGRPAGRRVTQHSNSDFCVIGQERVFWSEK